MDKTHEELVAEFENLQNTYRETVMKNDEKCAELIEQRDDFESLYLRERSGKIGIEQGFDNLLKQIRALAAERDTISNQLAAARIELENRQNKIDELNAEAKKLHNVIWELSPKADNVVGTIGITNGTVNMSTLAGGLESLTQN